MCFQKHVHSSSKNLPYNLVLRRTKITATSPMARSPDAEGTGAFEDVERISERRNHASHHNPGPGASMRPMQPAKRRQRGPAPDIKYDTSTPRYGQRTRDRTAIPIVRSPN